MRHLRRHQRVSSFVIRRVLLFLVGEQQRLALHAHQDFIFCQFEVEVQNGFAVLPRRCQRCFIDHVGQVRTGKTRCSASQHGEIYILSKRNLTGMYAQNLFASANIGTADDHPAIETPGP